jgi:cytochrome c-type biogenesis protein
VEQLATSFGLGLVATASPCVLPLYPGYLAYLGTLGGEQRAGGHPLLYALLVIAGVLSMMIALGLVMATLQVATGQVLRYLVPLADAVLVLMGLLLLLGRNPFARLSLGHGAPTVRRPALAAFVYGLLYGPLVLPCSAPVVVALFALSLTPGDFLDSLALFLAFGLGFGVPLLALGALGGLRARAVVDAVLRYEPLILRAAGLVLVVVGVADFANNWPTIQLYWA